MRDVSHSNTKHPRFVIAGAGSVGCFVGGALAHHSRCVHFLARPKIAEELSQFGLTLTDCDGLCLKLIPGQIDIATTPEILSLAEVIVVTVKSKDTHQIAQLIAKHASPHALIISLQNGVENADVLGRNLSQQVLAALVPFNVVHMGKGHFHRGTSGKIVIEQDAAHAYSLLNVNSLPTISTPNITALQWGKLLLNLNNALNALSGLPLRQQLQERAWRRILADQIEEAITVLRKSRIDYRATTAVPLLAVPHLLRLPTFLFRIAAGRMLKIDPQARSSMWEDLEHRRSTEIDYLQGAIVRLAMQNRCDVPLTQLIIKFVKEAEAANNGSPRLEPHHLRRRWGDRAL